MTMTPYNTDLTRALKWLHNKAPNLQTIIQKKSDWYHRYNDQFWTNWQQNVFDIRTANAFGLVVWCIILGLPLDIFDFAPITNAFAFGKQRGNYLDGGGHQEPITFVSGPQIYAGGTLVPSANYSLNSSTDQVTFNVAPTAGSVLTWTGTVTGQTGQQLVVNEPRKFGTGDGTTTAFSLILSDSANFNTVGFNFYGGGSESVALLNEVRYACQLRYVALVSNGRQQWINQMLQYIFNHGSPWDFPGKKYFYLHDATGAVQPVTGASIWRSDWQGNILLFATPRTNLMPYSNEIATSNGWATSNATLTNSTGPDGTANGEATITPVASGSPATANLSTAMSGMAINTVYTFSAFLKGGSSPESKLFVYDSTGSTMLGWVNITWFSGTPTIDGSGGPGIIAQSAKVTPSGVSGWYRVQFTFNSQSNSTFNPGFLSDITSGTGTVTVAYPQIEQGSASTSYISTTGASASSPLTDYSLNTSSGAVAMSVAPVNGAVLTWQGTWNWSSWTSPNQFGVGNGSATTFTLTEPPGAVKPITNAFYMEYRIGANMKLSAQFVNILNNQSYGIMPQCAGVKYTVVQES
jgi:hypothetical protein